MNVCLTTRKFYYTSGENFNAVLFFLSLYLIYSPIRTALPGLCCRGTETAATGSCVDKDAATSLPKSLFVPFPWGKPQQDLWELLSQESAALLLADWLGASAAVPAPFADLVHLPPPHHPSLPHFAPFPLSPCLGTFLCFRYLLTLAPGVFPTGVLRPWRIGPLIDLILTISCPVSQSKKTQKHFLLEKKTHFILKHILRAWNVFYNDRNSFLEKQNPIVWVRKKVNKTDLRKVF